MTVIRALAVIFLSLFWTIAGAQTQAFDVGPLEGEPAPLVPYVSVLEDSTRALTLEDVQMPARASQFKPAANDGKSLNYGFTSSAYWLRIQFNNTREQSRELMLEIANARLSQVDFYRLSDQLPDRVVETGYARPFAQRAYAHRFFVFPLNLPANTSQVIYLRFESPSTMDLPVKLWTQAAFHAHEIRDYMVQSVFWGMVGAMVLFNLLLWVFLRDRSYGLYVLFVLGNALGQSSATGLGMQFLWDGAPYWSTVSFAVGASIAVIFLMQLMRDMIGTARLIPRFDKWLQFTMAINVLTLLLVFVAYRAEIGVAVVNFSALMALMAAVVCSFKGERAARIFLLAFSALILGVILTGLRIAGWVPTNFVTSNGIQFGSAIEMILLAFAMADRFNTERREKMKAQAEALQAERHLVETLKESERLLEARVAERTAELSATVARLGQTQAELVQADKLASLGALVAGVSHELNTPIGNALTTASVLQDASRDIKKAMERGEMRKSTLTYFVESASGMSDLIVRSCQRAATLISSFKQVAVDQTSEQRRTFSLRELVEDNVAAMRPGFRDQPWAIETDIPTNIRCDSYPGPLGQVVANLVQNAVVHAFDGRTSGKLMISACLHDDHVVMEFSDDGVGIKPASLARIFEPFFTSRLGHGGSGLGLSVSLNIVTGVLGGTLTASSEMGCGSTLVAKFPLVAPQKLASVI
jgi:two-component system sensor histidine kinase/response regulator